MLSTLPTAEELADVYDRGTLQYLKALSARVHDVNAERLMEEGIRLLDQRELMGALDLGKVREKREALRLQSEAMMRGYLQPPFLSNTLIGPGVVPAPEQASLAAYASERSAVPSE